MELRHGKGFRPTVLGAEIRKGNMMVDCIEMFKCPFVKICHRQDKESSKELQSTYQVTGGKAVMHESGKDGLCFPLPPYHGDGHIQDGEEERPTADRHGESSASESTAAFHPSSCQRCRAPVLGGGGTGLWGGVRVCWPCKHTQNGLENLPLGNF